MIIVKFYSGIGNQLYQYAVLTYLEKLYPNQRILADISAFEDDVLLNHGNGFSYGFGIHDFFGINISIATEEEIKRIYPGIIFGRRFRRLFPEFVKRYVGNSRLSRLRALLFKKYRLLYDSYLTNAPFNSFNGNLRYLDSRDYYVDGLWQNYEYIKLVEDTLKSRLKLGLPKMTNEKINKVYNQILEYNSVCIHVRRGNFTTPENQYSHSLCGIDYYEKALRLVKNKVATPKFFVFSDDIEYCKSLFNFLDDITYVSEIHGLDTPSEMFLMSCCKAAIIPNSTFAFWSIWLGETKNKLVVCPKYIVREKSSWAEFSVPDNWIKIDNLE